MIDYLIGFAEVRRAQHPRKVVRIVLGLEGLDEEKVATAHRRLEGTTCTLRTGRAISPSGRPPAQTRSAADFSIFRNAISGTLSNFRPSVLSDLRSGRIAKADPAILAHIRTASEAIAAGQFAEFFPCEPVPTSNQMLHWLPFRYSVALYALAIKWINVGGHSSANPETLRNDGIDMFYVAYGTPFDEVISKDPKLSEIFELASAVLGT